MSIADYVGDLAKGARDTQFQLSQLSTLEKNKILEKIAQKIEENTAFIIAENDKDLEAAKVSGLTNAVLRRLKVDVPALKKIASAVREVIGLPDPIGSSLSRIRRPNGLIISKVRVPIGVIGIIYESRPNVTVDVAVLGIKSSNSVILKGGSEAINSNRAFVKIIKSAIIECGAPDTFVQFIDSHEHKAVFELLQLSDYVNLIIPRGGHNLIKFVTDNSKIPVIKHDMGICHTFVDKTADMQKALNICYNAKVQNPAVCNTMETLLVHKDIAQRFLPMMAKRYKADGVELRGCKETMKILPDISNAKEADWHTEYLDMVLSIRIVDSTADAVIFINKYGSHHSDAIVTENYTNAMAFLKGVDSAAVYVNASTRFTDGGEFGLGAEIGISTERIHARGPMGLEELTTIKYEILGDGQVRE